VEEYQGNICPKCSRVIQYQKSLAERNRDLEQEGRIYYNCGYCDKSWYVKPTPEKIKEILARPI
jgi:hypothetical protein